MLESYLTRFSGISCLSFTSNKVFYFSQVKFVFNQKENRGFVWSKMLDFLFKKTSNIYSEKRSSSLEVAVFYFLGTPI